MLDIAPELAVPVTDVDHAIGPAGAPVTLVEYGDYECPSCLNAQPVVRQLIERFGDRLRVVFRHFPQSGVHPRASAAAEAAEAAGDQGGQKRFWEMHEALYKNHQRLADVDLTHLALRLGLDVYKFQQATGTGLFAPRVRGDHDGGARSGVAGTPAFFINGRRYRGTVDVESLAGAIEEAGA